MLRLIAPAMMAAGLALPAGGADAQQPTDFEAQIPQRLGGDANGDGIVDGARTPGTALDDQIIRLRIRVPEPLCGPSAEYEWRVNGLPTPIEQTGGCRFSLQVVEGEHQISLVRAGEREPTATAVVTAADHLIVSIGDSVASGEGNPDVGGRLLGGARWLDQRCHRSMLSGAARAARRIERGEEISRVTFVPLGCSGASVPRGLLGEYKGFEPREGSMVPAQVPQLNALAAGGDVDAVLINVGGNDVAFESIIRFCAGVKNCPSKRFDPGGLRESKDPDDPLLEDFVASVVERLSTRLDMLDARLSSRIPSERILLVEYFDPTQGPNGFCKMLAGQISREESEWAHEEVLRPLNETLREAAKRHEWTYIDGVEEAFRGRGICAGSERRWIRTPTESFVAQNGFNSVNRLSGTLHPNGSGHSETAGLIGKRLGPILGADFDENPVEPLGGGGGLSGLAWFLIVVAAAVLLATAAATAYLLLRSRRRASGV